MQLSKTVGSFIIAEVSPLGEVESEELVLPPVTNLGSALLATLTESEQNAESITSDGIPVVPEDDLDHDDEDSADSQGQVGSITERFLDCVLEPGDPRRCPLGRNFWRFGFPKKL